MECKADLRGSRSPLHGLRFHDLRHHAIRELAESQAKDSIIREIAGHVSSKRLAHYSHVRMETKRKVLDALSGGGSGGSYGTNNDTNCSTQFTEQSQVCEPMGFEPTTSSMPSSQVTIAGMRRNERKLHVLNSLRAIAAHGSCLR